MQSEPKTLPRAVSKKATDRLIATLKAKILTGDMAAVGALLCEFDDPDLLTHVREQKLVLRAPINQRRNVADLLSATARRLRSPGQGDFEIYLEFALEIDAVRGKSVEQLHASLRRMPRCSTADLLAAAEEVFEWCLSKQFKRAELFSAGIAVAENERRFHAFNGAVNDITMAVARVVNEYSRISQTPLDVSLTRAQRRQFVQLLRSAVPVAGNVNSLEWFFDSVTYGEFTVDKAVQGKQPTYRFHFVDAKRYLLKALAIRRTVVKKFASEGNPRFVREKLQELEAAMLEEAADHYIRDAEIVGRAEIDLSGARKTSSAMLRILEAEDDLLLAAALPNMRPFAHYLVAMMMRWYCVAARAVRDAPQVINRRWLQVPPIPLDDLPERVAGVDKALLREALGNLTLDLPARSHTRLADLPFVRDGADVARPFLGGRVGTWPCVVREVLIQGGAVGKNVGAIWEDFYAKSFEGTDWKIVGKGVKLRDGGKTLTDVDLLVLRDDLLLVMQVKALIGLADGPYDHWRNRQTIQFGCTQARIAVEFLEANPSALIGICGARIAATIKQVQPIVLTNINELDGWRSEDVPVIGEVTRKAICQGAKVDYRDGRTGEVVHTHHFVKQEELTTATILQLLQEPVEMRVASERTQTSHSAHRVAGLTLLLPEFMLRPDAQAPAPHEPQLELQLELQATAAARSQGKLSLGMTAR